MLGRRPGTADCGRPVRRAAGYLAATVVVVAAFALGFVITQSERQTGQAAPQRTTDPSIRLIDEVRDELNAAYYRWIHPDVPARPTVDGILDGLEDPHTEVLTAAEFESLRDRTDGTYSGIGLTVGERRPRRHVGLPGPCQVGRDRARRRDRPHRRRDRRRQAVRERADTDQGAAGNGGAPAGAKAASGRGVRRRGGAEGDRRAADQHARSCG